MDRKQKGSGSVKQEAGRVVEVGAEIGKGSCKRDREWEGKCEGKYGVK
jgi:hypothetical protein